MADFVKYFEEKDLTGYVLILPSVSVGNVPQLTIDLIISSLPCQKIASIWHPAIIPSVGGDAYDDSNTGICTACELYVNEALRIAVIQLRSGIEFQLAKDFFSELKYFISKQYFSNVMILTTSFDYELHNITKEKFYYISNYPINEEVFSKLSPRNMVKKLEPNFGGRHLVHGSGFAIKLHDFFGSDINSTVLIKFVSEGDNVTDAISYIDVLSSFIVQFSLPSQIKIPISWKYIYGSPPPVGIY